MGRVGGCAGRCCRRPGRLRQLPAAEEQTEFTVILKSGGDKKLNVIKEVRTIISGLGIKEAKELVEAGGKTIKEGVTKEEAAKIKKQLEDQGAVVEIK